jgi:hypothetical protein
MEGGMDKNIKTEAERVFDMLEHVFVTEKNILNSKSNKWPVESENKIEYDFSDTCGSRIWRLFYAS